jgi:chondroitin sulfate proteoglycan 4
VTGGEGGGFDFTVSDAVKTTGVLSFGVTARKVTLNLIAPGSSHLHVFPMRRQTLTSAQLFALASDIRRPVSYIVKSQPSLGSLMIESVPSGNIRPATNFTQRDVNNSRIFYEHTHPFFGLSTNDSFTFDVRADFAKPLLDQVRSGMLFCILAAHFMCVCACICICKTIDTRYSILHLHNRIFHKI